MNGKKGEAKLRKKYEFNTKAPFFFSLAIVSGAFVYVSNALSDAWLYI